MKLGIVLVGATISGVRGAGTAQAAPITLEDDGRRASGATFQLEGSTLVYTASPGVNNWPFVAVGDDGSSLLISDPLETIVPSAGCVLPGEIDVTTVLCPMPAEL